MGWLKIPIELVHCVVFGEPERRYIVEGYEPRLIRRHAVDAEEEWNRRGLEAPSDSEDRRRVRHSNRIDLAEGTTVTRAARCESDERGGSDVFERTEQGNGRGPPSVVSQSPRGAPEAAGRLEMWVSDPCNSTATELSV